MSKKSGIFWAGFVDGKIHDDPVYNKNCSNPEHRRLHVYKSKAEASRGFEDVRPVKIVQVRK